MTVGDTSAAAAALAPRAGGAAVPALAVRGIVKRFGGVVALDGCSFEVARGSVTGLIGPNGAGKTTLFSVASGFLRPDAGTVALDGVDVTGLGPPELFRRGLVRTFQIPQEFERMTVQESLMLVPGGQSGENVLRAWFSWRTVMDEERRNAERAREVLDFLSLGGLRNEYAGNLSGGQKKLLELGRAMMSGAKTVLLDEPGAGVNPVLLARLADDIQRLNAEHGYTFCIVEHNMDLIERLCDPVVAMAAGCVLAQGHMDELRNDPRVLEAYLSRAPVADPG